jgi:hypothetical protein
MAPSEATIRNLKLYLLPSIALTFLVITIALVIVVYVDNREIDSNIQQSDVGYMESLASANGFAGTVTSNQLTVTTTTGIGLMQGKNFQIVHANPESVTAVPLTGYSVNAPGTINDDQSILQAFDCLMTRSTTLAGFIAGPTNLDNLVTNDLNVIQSMAVLQGQLTAAKNLFLFRADEITVQLDTNDTFIWSTNPMIYGSQFVPANTLVEGDVLYFETCGSLTIAGLSDTTTTFSVLPAPVSTVSVLTLGAAVYFYTCKNWVTMVTLVSPTSMTYQINSIVTATNNATGIKLAVNTTMQGQTLNPQLQQQFELALKEDLDTPVFDVTSAFGKYETKIQP